MINFQKSKFISSYPEVSALPFDGRPGILLLGRSNVGKSTLINALLGQKIAFTSKKAGKTKLLNSFLIDETFYLIDAPGYGSTGYATMSTISFSKMVEDSIKDRAVSAFALLLDLRKEIGKDDQAFIDYLKNCGKRLLVILTKVDMMNQKELALAKKRASEAGIKEIVLSDSSNKTVVNVRAALAKIVGK